MKKNIYRKCITIIIWVLFAIVLGFIAKLLIIGEPVDGEQVYCVTYVNGQNLELKAEAVESDVALRGWKYKQDGNTLYISARKVLVSPLFDERHYETSIDVNLIENILLGGKTIWSSNG